MRRADAAAADDIVSEVFVIAWRRIDEVPEDALPWLLGTARRVLANTRRAAGRRDALQRRLKAQFPPAVAWEAPGAEHAILRALAQLNESDREALLLVAWEGLTVTQAAKGFGVGPRVFSMRLYRARRRLARALGRENARSQQQTEARCESA